MGSEADFDISMLNQINGFTTSIQLSIPAFLSKTYAVSDDAFAA
jgi:hypothetical protein